MAYAAQVDLNLDAQRLIELTDSADEPNAVDVALLEQLEAESEGIVNAMLSGTGLVPFADPVPPIIKMITAAIWSYRIYRHREVVNIPPTVQDDYKLAFDLMTKIAEGDIEVVPSTPDLVGVPEVESSPARGWTPRDLV